MRWELVPDEASTQAADYTGFAGPSEDCEISLKSNGKALSGSEQRSVP